MSEINVTIAPKPGHQAQTPGEAAAWHRAEAHKARADAGAARAVSAELAEAFDTKASHHGRQAAALEAMAASSGRRWARRDHADSDIPTVVSQRRADDLEATARRDGR